MRAEAEIAARRRKGRKKIMRMDRLTADGADGRGWNYLAEALVAEEGGGAWLANSFIIRGVRATRLAGANSGV
jgi:hypothetical protein